MAVDRRVLRPRWGKVRAGLAAGFLALSALAPTPKAVLAAAPVDGGPLTILPVAINTGPGDQYDAHVSGDLVSYSDGADQSIHYYDFFTGLDRQVPTASNSDDQLSDVSNGRVAFARLDLSTFDQTVELFDTGSNTTATIDPQNGLHPSNPGLGADSVALISDLTPTGELVAAHVAGTATRITNDARVDRQPQVSPVGDLIVWESCATSPSNCDIHQAAWNGTTWAVTALTDSADPEANPDTNGTTVAYDAVRSGQRDICWQPAGGGAEQCLGLPGEQRNPSIAGGVILFEDLANGPTADLFAYEISTNRLFRITNTPPLDESLSDITKLADGRYRVVWNSGDAPERDVFGATFELPPVGPAYAFGGFTSPVDALPTLNLMKAGGAVPVKFGLGGDFGLSIFAAGYPKSQTVACDATAPVDGVEETLTAGGSSLGYDATTGLYSYVWKSDKSWTGTCRQLVLKFTDGSIARADFKFK